MKWPLAALVLAPLMLVPSPPILAEIMPTSGETLDISLTTTPETFGAGEEIKMHIEFINPTTQDTQIHIDYFVTIFENGNAVFGPTERIHTSDGKPTIPTQFLRDGEYEVKIDVDGILFNPIQMETASFILTAGEGMPAANTPDPSPTNENDNGCLIATAAFGSEMAHEVQMLREIRDHSLLATESGTAFMSGFNQIYYMFSPTVADWERQNPAFREAVKASITPLLWSLSLLGHEDMDSEAEVLGYGVGIIALNLGMYIGLPLAGILKLHQVRSRPISG